MSSSRGLRVMKAIELYRKYLPKYYDVSIILSKVNIISMSQGCTKGSFIVDSSMCNGAGTLHGGYVASVIDVMTFFSIISNSNGKVSWTTNLNVNYFKMATSGDKVAIETKLLKDGSTPVLETNLYDISGATLAKGIASFQAGSEKYQTLFKEVTKFDVYEK